ncbi:MAG TPA: two-component regulator propeller domain-containing protein, partial [Verrucomicrobiae bacterium]|nr:two-component regulator propeller domain-containing protein [Verrucomicrobiae bacterium]
MPARVRRGSVFHFQGLLLVWLLLICAKPARAAVLWSDLGATLVKDSGPGSDILHGAVKRDTSSTDTLYFKFHVDPLSDANTEEYFAAFQLFEGDQDRLAVGNSLKAWAYSAFNTAETGQSNTNTFGDFDLRSSLPESIGVGTFKTFELPRRGVERTIVFKVKYVGGTNDEVTVWLNPDLSQGATEASQPETLTTHFIANASFDQLRIRHGGGGQGWTFSDMAVATSFGDFVAASGAERGGGVGAGLDNLPFAFRSWQREQGLPQNAVHALAQTLDGYLWVGSDDGVARFDGVRFLSFGFREGLRAGPVRKLLADSRGALWIGSSGGLTCFQNGQFATYTASAGLPADAVTALAEDKDGRIWVGTEQGLAVWQNDQPMALGALLQFKGKVISALFKDRQGVMWVGVVGAGVFQFLSGKFEALADPSPEELLKDAHCLLVDKAARLWIGAGDDIILCREAGEWRRTRIPRNLATRPFVTTLVEESNGTVWAGSVSDGLVECSGGKLTVVNAGGGLLDNLVESLLVDREDNLWVATDAGLNQLRHKSIGAFAQGDGLDYGPVQGLAEIKPGVVWAAKPDGLYRWEGQRFSRLTPAGLPHGDLQIRSLLLARDGSCWAGTSRGLFQFKNPGAAAPDVEKPLLSQADVLCLDEDKDGTIWAGTRAGEVWRCSNGAGVLETNFSQTHSITVLFHDRDGAIWLGTDGNGLLRIQNADRSHYGKSDGLASDAICALHLDSEGALWIGTSGGGLSELRNGHITTFTTREGLPDNTVSQILEDDSGRLWLGGNRGISCISKLELREAASGKLAVIYPQVYGRPDGMLSEVCSGGFSPAGLKTKAGQLWFPTAKGIAVADPHPQSSPVPPVVLEEVLLDGVAAPDLRITMPKPVASAEESPEAFRIPPGRHRLEFQYTALSFNAPERVRFRYRLENLDSDWTEAGTRRTALYNYVPPGQYHFRVIACNSDGVWNEAG